MTITVQLDWKPNVQFAGLLLAVHNGWFEAENLSVEIIPWRPATDPLEHVPTSIGLVSVSEDNLTIQAAAAGHTVKMLGSMLQKSPLAWMVLQDSPIEDVSGFAGKTIGVHVDGVTGLQYAMKTAGLELTDANVIDVPYNKMDQLRDGAIDVCQCNGLVEPVEMGAAGVPVRVIWACDLGYSVYSQVLSTSTATLDAHGDEIKKFMEVLWRGWTAVYEDVEGTARIIFEEFLHETSSAVQHSILDIMKPFVFGDFADLIDDSPVLGSIDPVRLQSSINLLRANGVIDQQVEATDLLL